MYQESSKASSSSEPADDANLSANHGNNDIKVDPRASEDMKGVKRWINPADLKQV